MPKIKGTLELQDHGIQLNFVSVKEIHFTSTQVPSTIADSDYGSPSITTGRSNYDQKAKTIQVGVKFELNGANDVFNLRVELVSQFRVDETKFPKDKVHEWADKASFYILFPFLREHVYSLAGRAGLKALTIPLMHLHPFTIDASIKPPATLEMAH